VINIRSAVAAKRDEGASAIEYVLLAALLAVILIGGITLFGNFLNDTFADTCEAVVADGNAASGSETADPFKSTCS
jgi:Flp pilus assembly pilin Flp